MPSPQAERGQAGRGRSAPPGRSEGVFGEGKGGRFTPQWQNCSPSTQSPAAAPAAMASHQIMEEVPASPGGRSPRRSGRAGCDPVPPGPQRLPRPHPGPRGSGRSGGPGPSSLPQLPPRCRTQRPRPQLQAQRDEGVKATCAPYTPQSGVTLAPRHHLVPINTWKGHGAAHGKAPGAPGRQSRQEPPGPRRTHPSLRAGCAQPARGSQQEFFPRHQQGLARSREAAAALGRRLRAAGARPRPRGLPGPPGTDVAEPRHPQAELPQVAALCSCQTDRQTDGHWDVGSGSITPWLAVGKPLSGRPLGAPQHPLPGMPQHGPRRCRRDARRPKLSGAPRPPCGGASSWPGSCLQPPRLSGLEPLPHREGDFPKEQRGSSSRRLPEGLPGRGGGPHRHGDCSVRPTARSSPLDLHGDGEGRQDPAHAEMPELLRFTPGDAGGPGRAGGRAEHAGALEARQHGRPGDGTVMQMVSLGSVAEGSERLCLLRFPVRCSGRPAERRLQLRRRRERRERGRLSGRGAAARCLPQPSAAEPQPAQGQASTCTALGCCAGRAALPGAWKPRLGVSSRRPAQLRQRLRT